VRGAVFEIFNQKSNCCLDFKNYDVLIIHLLIAEDSDKNMLFLAPPNRTTFKIYSLAKKNITITY
jgi:hypothetical protein